MKLSPTQIRINYASHSERQDKRYFKFPFYIYLICLPSPSLDLQSSIQMFSFPFAHTMDQSGLRSALSAWMNRQQAACALYFKIL